MTSLYDELRAKLQKDPRLTRRGGPRYDLGLLMFNAGDSLRELWLAAEQEVATVKATGRQPTQSLVAAVDKLRPIFGERDL